MLLLQLLQRDEAGAVGGADTGPAVLHWLVRDGELSQVVADHLRLHLNLQASSSQQDLRQFSTVFTVNWRTQPGSGLLSEASI
jgi:hypothetical protein